MRQGLMKPSLTLNSLCIPGWPRTPDHHTSASRVLALQAHTAMMIISLLFLSYVGKELIIFSQSSSPSFFYSPLLLPQIHASNMGCSWGWAASRPGSKNKFFWVSFLYNFPQVEHPHSSCSQIPWQKHSEGICLRRQSMEQTRAGGGDTVDYIILPSCCKEHRQENRDANLAVTLWAQCLPGKGSRGPSGQTRQSWPPPRAFSIPSHCFPCWNFKGSQSRLPWAHCDGLW